MADFEEDRGYTNRQSRNLREKSRRDQFNILLTELGNVLELMDPSGNSSSQEHSGGNRGKAEKTTILKSTISYLQRQQERENASARTSNTDEFNEWKPSFVSNDAFM